MVGLALPVAAVQVGMMFMGVVDTIMVGHFSARDLAAVALGNLYFFTAIVFPMGLLLSLDPVVSQAVGAGDRPAVGRAFQRGGVAGLVAEPPRRPGPLCRGPPSSPSSGNRRRWCRWLPDTPLASIPGVFPFLAFIVLRQTLQAMGRVAPIVVTIVLANLANLFFNWVLIFGKLGFSRWARWVRDGPPAFPGGSCSWGFWGSPGPCSRDTSARCGPRSS